MYYLKINWIINTRLMGGGQGALEKIAPGPLDTPLPQLTTQNTTRNVNMYKLYRPTAFQ